MAKNQNSLPPVLRLQSGVDYNLEILKLQLDGHNPYLHVNYNGNKYTLFLDNGLDTHFKDAKVGEKYSVKNVNENGHREIKVQNITNDHDTETNNSKLPPKLTIKEDHPYYLVLASHLLKTGENQYGSYCLYRVIYNGALHSLFADKELSSNLSSFNIGDKLIVTKTSKGYTIEPILNENKIEYSHSEFYTDEPVSVIHNQISEEIINENMLIISNKTKIIGEIIQLDDKSFTVKFTLTDL